ncbi:MAG: hypothetical protein HY560_11345 [Gemmatimonadetes bacterium]|nr:hypothetical protein [Gemmatimonadota bacterium]
MAIHPLVGHDQLRNRLAGAIASSRFPQAALFIGIPGVGKQRLALWVAQTLLCEASGADGPCGRCSACRHVLGLSHPDLHWFIPIPRPKAPEPAKQLDEAAELLAEVLEARRRHSLYRRPDGMTGHSLASVRLLQRRVALTPAVAARKVVIVGDAERLVVQDASPEAANALLKVLEEPPGDTFLILTAADPQALLPTVRSRLVPIRVQRLPDQTVAGFLASQVQPPLADAAALERRVLLAEGSIGRALWLEEDADAAEGAAQRFLAALQGGARSWSQAAMAQPPWAARGDFTAMLDALALQIRGRVASAQRGEHARLRQWTTALRRVEIARWEAQSNANPQLAVATLAQDLRGLV